MKGNKKGKPKESAQDFNTVINVLDSILEKSNDFAQHMDTEINILVGSTLAIFIFSASRFQNERGEISLPFLTLALFSIISTLVGLFAIHPFRFMRKRGQEESLMYNKEIISFPSFSEYAQELKRITNDKEAIINQYAKEIYNICKYYYRPKRELFHLARRIFIIGFALSSLFFIIELF